MINLNKFDKRTLYRLASTVEPFFVCAKKPTVFRPIHKLLMKHFEDKYSLEVWCIITGCVKSVKNNRTRFYLPRTKGVYSEAKKFSHQKISYGRMMHVCSMLEYLGYIEIYKGFKYSDDYFCKSFIDIKSELYEMFDKTLCEKYALQDNMCLVEISNTKKMKKQGKKLKVKEQLYTQGVKGIQIIKENLLSYNKLLESTEVEIDGRSAGKIIYKRSYHKNLKGSGRFYVTGSLFQTEKSESRKTITINGEPTCEVDLKSLHPSILMCWSGLSKPVNYKPYEVTLEGRYNKQEFRSFCKSSFMAILFSEDTREAKSAISNKLLSDMRKKKHEQEYRSLHKIEGLCVKTFNALLSHNHMIKEHFFSGELWASLQNVDANICDYVVKHFTNKGVAVLSYHDSWVISYKHRDELISVMRQAWKTYVHSEGDNFGYDVEFDNTPKFSFKCS